MPNTLLIVDAMNLIRRIHAVSENQHPTEKSSLIATLHASVNACLKLLKQVPSSHVIAVFDGQQPSWRHDIYPEYKQGRKPAPSALVEYLEPIQDALLAQGIESLVSESDEADDLIATLASKVASKHKQVCIVSTDKGFFQLHQTYIVQYDHFAQTWFNSQQHCQKLGIQTSQLLDYWALVGISGSNIKGAAGIGPKSAAKLLHELQTIEDIEKADSEDKLVRKAQADISNVKLAKQLLTLKHDIPLGFSLKELRYSPQSP
ncbi:flap endonuclease Xni [Motilimonas pumila]|uniref:Flap endonuclease Xni n=1 Tax=Motilimonas pumila TaxID=2303987 RepID=A0A418YJP8_9GAMM|nr:flap endonuclease Xni [Motilimonas pumila]RJG51204.1 flap endonuclease Xni [Motilimonas pumila]